MLFFCIGALILGAIMRFQGQFSPLDVICFVAGGFFGLCYLLKRIKKAIWKLIRKPLCILLTIGVIAMIATLIPIKNSVESQPEKDCDYLIFLGCKVEGDRPTPVLQDRINAAYNYLVAHPDTICIASGGLGDDEQISEAQCIFNELTTMGISPERILLEDKATCTSENFKYSLAMIKEDQATIGVLSSEFHLYRASLMAKANNIDPIFIAAPTTGTATRIGYTVREIFALWKYLLIGE